MLGAGTCQLSPVFRAEDWKRCGQQEGKLLQGEKHRNPHPNLFPALWPWGTLQTLLNEFLGVIIFKKNLSPEPSTL